MIQQETDNNRNLSQPSPGSASKKQKPSRGGWIFVLLALAVITFIISTEKKQTVKWINDYQAGMEQAKKQNKPVLLAFESDISPLCADMRRDTYVDSSVIKYIEENFVPILVDADENTRLAKEYAEKIPQYPTHIVMWPDKSKMSSVFGHDLPAPFIKKLSRALERIKK